LPGVLRGLPLKMRPVPPLRGPSADLATHVGNRPTDSRRPAAWGAQGLGLREGLPIAGGPRQCQRRPSGAFMTSILLNAFALTTPSTPARLTNLTAAGVFFVAFLASHPAWAGPRLDEGHAVVDPRGFAFAVPVGTTASAKDAGWLITPIAPTGVVVVPHEARTPEALSAALGANTAPLKPLAQPGLWHTGTIVQGSSGKTAVVIVVAMNPAVGSLLFISPSDEGYAASLLMAGSVVWRRTTDPDGASAPREGSRASALRARISGHLVNYHFSASSNELYALCPDGTFTSNSGSNISTANHNALSGATSTMRHISSDQDRGTWRIEDDGGVATVFFVGASGTSTFTPASFYSPEELKTTDTMHIERAPGSKSTAHLEVGEPISCAEASAPPPRAPHGKPRRAPRKR
jgi:hypothetical protein